MRFNPDPNQTNVFYDTGRFYYLQYLPLADNGFMLQSPSNNLWMIVTRHEDGFHIVPYHHTSRDNWIKLRDKRIYTPQGILTPAQVLAKADAAANQLNHYQHANGWISPDYFSHLSKFKAQYGPLWLKQSFTSTEGQQFINAYLSQGPQMSSGQLKELGNGYYKTLYQRLQKHPEHEVYMPEFLLVSMLAHVKEPQIQQACVASQPSLRTGLAQALPMDVLLNQETTN